jgi:hypothetical protein
MSKNKAILFQKYFYTVLAEKLNITGLNTEIINAFLSRHPMNNNQRSNASNHTNQNNVISLGTNASSHSSSNVSSRRSSDVTYTANNEYINSPSNKLTPKTRKKYSDYKEYLYNTEKKNRQLNQEKNNLERQRNEILSKLNNIKTQQNHHKKGIEDAKLLIQQMTKKDKKNNNKDKKKPNKWSRFLWGRRF